MTDTIQWARLEDPSPAVQAIIWPEPSYMYLERVPDAWLNEDERRNGLRLEVLDPATPFGEWERGRIFCEAFEVRWEKLDGRFQTVYVGPPVGVPGFSPADEVDLAATDSGTCRYYLWGNRVPDDKLPILGADKPPNAEVFIEFRVPRVLHYPVSSDARRVKLKVCEYVDPTTGATVYHRFQGLEEE